MIVGQPILITQLQELYHYRDAIRHLVVRDLKVRYSNSVLGIVWSFFNPLLMTLVYSLVFTLLVPSGIANFPVFVLAALLPWNFFASSLIGSTTAITLNGHLINRVYFPREILPVAVILSNGVNFLIALGLLFSFILFFRIPVGVSLLWLPALLALQLTLTLGFSLFLSAVNVFFRDTQQIVDVVMLAWFFLTPVIYPIDVAGPTVGRLMQALNPMAALVVAYRQVLYAGATPDLAILGVTVLQAALVVLVGTVVFRRLSPAFAEEV